MSTGSEVEVDMENDVLTDLSTGKKFNLKPLGDVSVNYVLFRFFKLFLPENSTSFCFCLQAGPVIDDGGIFEHARRTGMIKTA